MNAGTVLALLAMLAEQSGENVSQPRLEFMARKLLEHDASRVAAALEAMLESARRFPTIADVKAKMGVAELSDDDKGREVAERIWGAIARGWGSTLSPVTAKRRDEFVGPIGSAVVRMAGGWMRLAESVQNDEETTRKAQWREYARIVASCGGVGDAPAWDSLPPSAEVEHLAARFDVTPKIGAKK